MKPILVLRHIACEGLGYLGTLLEQKQIPYEMLHIDENQSLPTNIEAFSGLVIMGGPMSVNDDDAWIEEECDLIRQADSLNLPVLGHCLGGQMICKALGGEISANKVKEIGWLSVNQYHNEMAAHWFGEYQQFDAFHWHGETFSLPDGATPLLHSANCQNQAFVKGSLLALQCHLEITAEQVPVWADEYAHEIEQPTATIQSKQQMTENLEHRVTSLQQVANHFYQQWLACLPTT